MGMRHSRVLSECVQRGVGAALQSAAKSSRISDISDSTTNVTVEVGLNLRFFREENFEEDTR